MTEAAATRIVSAGERVRLELTIRLSGELAMTVLARLSYSRVTNAQTLCLEMWSRQANISDLSFVLIAAGRGDTNGECHV